MTNIKLKPKKADSRHLVSLVMDILDIVEDDMAYYLGHSREEAAQRLFNYLKEYEHGKITVTKGGRKS